MTAGETAPGTAGKTRRHGFAECDGSAGRGGSVDGEAETLARVALGRIAEPGDEVVGRSVRELGAAEVLRLLTGGGRLPGATERRMDGYRIRARGQDLDPAADVAAVRALGGRFVPPGDGEWPGQLDDLGDQRPLGLWVRGRPSLRLWALRSVAVVGARACSAYGTHVATTLGAELAETGWAVVSGAAYGVDAAVHRGALAVGGATAAGVAARRGTPDPRGHAGRRGAGAPPAQPGRRPPGRGQHLVQLRRTTCGLLAGGPVQGVDPAGDGHALVPHPPAPRPLGLQPGERGRRHPQPVRVPGTPGHIADRHRCCRHGRKPSPLHRQRKKAQAGTDAPRAPPLRGSTPRTHSSPA
ncbi:DNA-processing protein DprA [Streptomyces sp. NPDC059506]|uniref:DNA-processing protein DprA n=1 Tax=Streptomyces sp. NPDC059506 TaxID=3347751 RepID=UPI0036B8240F